MVAPRIRILLVDDHPIFLEGLVAGLSAQDDLEVIGVVGQGEEALSEARRLLPDVLVLDLGIPVMSGQEVIDVIRRDGNVGRVLVLTGDYSSAAMYAAVSAGVGGVLTKEAARSTIADAIRAVAAGGTFLAPEVSAAVAMEVRGRNPTPPRVTRRQVEVLRGVADGRSVPQIADDLGLAPSTVRGHVTALYEALGVSERAACVAVGMRLGLLD